MDPTGRRIFRSHGPVSSATEHTTHIVLSLEGIHGFIFSPPDPPLQYTMISGLDNRSPIIYPSLRMLLKEGDRTLEDHARAIEEVVYVVFGGRYHAMSPKQRRLRLELWKLVNLMRQLDILDDAPVYDLGFRCPEQLKSYERALSALIDGANREEVDAQALTLARRTHARLWQMCKVVRPFCVSLS